MTKFSDLDRPVAAARRVVCPNCGGNGYTKTPHLIREWGDTVRQCERCSSEGEIDDQI